jgi:hypothetical protein
VSREGEYAELRLVDPKSIVKSSVRLLAPGRWNNQHNRTKVIQVVEGIEPGTCEETICGCM